jgi:hypothetical protein
LRVNLILAALIPAALMPLTASAQPAPSQICISAALAQSMAAYFQQGASMLPLMQDAATEPQRQAAAVAAAVAKQKADDDAAKTKPDTPTTKP